MSLVKQILITVLVIAIPVGGWLVYDRWDSLFGGAATVDTAAAPGAGQPGAAGNRPAGAPPGAAGPGGGAPGAGGPGGRRGGFGGPPLVVAAPVEIDDSGTELQAIGTLAAVRAVTVFPQAAGLVTEVAAVPGALVKAGDVLVRLDDGDQRIAVERAEMALQAAKDALARAERLAQSQNITDVALATARGDAGKAEIDLRAAEVALARRVVVAPFAGTLGLVSVTLGEVVTTQTALTTLDDLSALTVAFTAPQAYAGRVVVGHPVVAMAEGAAGRPIEGAVSAVDSRVDLASRTFAAEATLSSGIEGLKPGMAVMVNVSFEGVPRPAVPSLAIQWDRRGSYVWKLDGEKVKRTDVSILGRSSGMVIVAAELAAGDEVVVEGLQRLREGATVARAGAGQNGPGGGGAAPGGVPAAGAPAAAANQARNG